jgi:hypothetical protein
MEAPFRGQHGHMIPAVVNFRHGELDLRAVVESEDGAPADGRDSAYQEAVLESPPVDAGILLLQFGT